MSKVNSVTQGEEMASKYNPDGIIPFPFQKIQEDHSDLKIYISPLKKDKVSGAIIYSKEDKNFTIIVNKNKPETRRYFTLAHEIAHYFLHGKIIKNEEILIDQEYLLDGVNNILFDLDGAESTKVEMEANNFALVLIMPEHLVKKVWDTVRDVEECAKVFRVSASMMSIRLENLQLLKID